METGRNTEDKRLEKVDTYSHYPLFYVLLSYGRYVKKKMRREKCCDKSK